MSDKYTMGFLSKAQLAPKRIIHKDSLEVSRRILSAWKEHKRQKNGLDLTQQTAADALSVTQPMFSQVLHGTVSVNPMMVLSVASLLRCDLNELIKGLKEYKILSAVSPTQSRSIPVSLTLTGKKLTGRTVNIMTSTISQAFAVEIDTDEYSPRYSVGEYAIIDPLSEWEVGNQILVRYGNDHCIIRVISNINNDTYLTYHPTVVGVTTEINAKDKAITVSGVIRGVQF